MSCNFFTVCSVSKVCLSVKATAHCHCHCNFAKTNYLDNNCFSFERFPICFCCFQFFFLRQKRRKKRFSVIRISLKQEVIHRVMSGCGHSSSSVQFAFQVVFSLLRCPFFFFSSNVSECVHVIHQCKPFF